MRVLITGMSGVGKTALVRELRERGFAAFDSDEDGFTEPREDGRWGWRADKVAALLEGQPSDETLFFAGCSEEQAEMPFDERILLSVPEADLVERLRTRTTNSYGQGEGELEQILGDLREVEPLLRRSASLELQATAAPPELADALLEHLSAPAP